MKIQKINVVNTRTVAKNKVQKNNCTSNAIQNNQLSNIYYQPISFSRKWKEHQSWGLKLNQDGSASAKIFTFPDAKRVLLEVNEQKTFPLENKGEGIFEGKIPQGEIKEKDKYKFVIQKANGEVIKAKDPYSYSQSDILGASEAYDHKRFVWHDENWFKNSKARITRNANSKNGLTPLGGAKIYELNVASFTQKGNLEGAKEELKRIKDTGFNAIEIMPVENTYSYNWGYDGVDKFAVSSFLGGADKLKELIDYAHELELNVIMDMVPNHIGPDGAQLSKTGPYANGYTGWGEAFNYEGKNSKYVRDFMVNAALNWVENFHCDGLRLDMTQHMKSDMTMQQIVAEVNYHFPDVFMIAEDGRSNVSARGDEYWHDWWQPYDQRIATPLKPSEVAQGENEDVHCERINDIENYKVPLSRLGFDSEWDFHYHHTLDKLAYGEGDLDAIERAIVDSKNRVAYLASHDEIGNKDGTRNIAKYMVPLLSLEQNVYLTDEDYKRAQDYVEHKKRSGADISYDSALYMVKAQKVQQVAMKLAQLVQDGTIADLIKTSNYQDELYMLDKLSIERKGTVTLKRIMSCFKEATKTYRALEALKYFTPGPIMTFQGEERIEMTKFNFFREFQSVKDEYYLYLEKGYPNGVQAYLDSKIGNQSYSPEGKRRMIQFENLIRDLNKFKDENPASNVGQVVYKDTIKHPQNPTIALHAKDGESGNETFVISNFSNLSYPIYEIEFPQGRWVEVINTDDVKYGGNGEFEKQTVLGFGKNDYSIKSKISLPAKSTLIFKRV